MPVCLTVFHGFGSGHCGACLLLNPAYDTSTKSYAYDGTAQGNMWYRPGLWAGLHTAPQTCVVAPALLGTCLGIGLA
jgi:hypothetical protein